MWGWMLEYLGFALSALGGAVSLALWLYGTGKLSGVTQANVAATTQNLERRMDDTTTQLERRMDEGGRRLSDLTSKLMVLPGTMAQLADEQTRQRIELGKMDEYISDLRVSVARLEERQRFGA